MYAVKDRYGRSSQLRIFIKNKPFWKKIIKHTFNLKNMKRELEYQQQKYIFLLPLLWLIGMYSLCNKGVYKSFNILFWAILAQFDLF